MVVMGDHSGRGSEGLGLRMAGLWCWIGGLVGSPSMGWLELHDLGGASGGLFIG